MGLVRSESRSRIGIDWYDTEAEAEAASEKMLNNPRLAGSIADANIGFAQCGRDRGFDLKDADGNRIVFAVVTP